MTNRERAREPDGSVVDRLIQRGQPLPRIGELRAPRDYLRRARIHRDLSTRGFTMIGARYGRNLLMLSETAEAEQIPGALVDCGVWNGGSTMLLSIGAPSREVWAFDSFEGLPSPGSKDSESTWELEGEVVGSEEKLRAGFRELRAEGRLHVVPGWFDKTLTAGAAEIGPIAVLHIDADWYDSITLALETLYPNISPGGFVAVDDYRHWTGAKRAVDDFRQHRRIRAPLRSSHYWRKPGEEARG